MMMLNDYVRLSQKQVQCDDMIDDVMIDDDVIMFMMKLPPRHGVLHEEKPWQYKPWLKVEKRKPE